MTISPHPDHSPRVELDHVGMVFPGAAASVDVLDDISLAVHAGESLAIIGPSGSGKSTLLNLIAGLLTPTSGTVRFEGEDLHGKSESDLAAYRNQSLGFIFQSHFLLPQCSALENVMVPTMVHPDKSVKEAAPKRATDLLERVGLHDRMSHRPGQLSGGECQRVSLARALINQPKLILADEPTGSLDEETADELTAMLTDLTKEHSVTLITVTHSMRLAKRMQRGVMLRRGRIEPWTPNE